MTKRPIAIVLPPSEDIMDDGRLRPGARDPNARLARILKAIKHTEKGEYSAADKLLRGIPKPAKRPIPKVGDILRHRVAGTVRVVKVRGDEVTVTFGMNREIYQWSLSSWYFQRPKLRNPWIASLKRLKRLVECMPNEIWTAKGRNVILMNPYTKEVILRCRTDDEAKTVALMHELAYGMVSYTLMGAKIGDRDMRKMLK
jgi:hypothetical protein